MRRPAFLVLPLVLLLAALPPTSAATPSAAADARVVPVPCPGAAFPDVPADHAFCSEIRWLSDEGLAGGYADGTFRPQVTVTRQVLAALLTRYLAPGPGPDACTSAPFSDVPPEHGFCRAIAFAADEGLVTGFTDGTFRPTLPVSRQALAAVLHRLAHGDAPPVACTTPPFRDVGTAHQFCGAIAWATATGLAGGYGDGTFRPAQAVTRQAIAAFVERYDRTIDGFVDPRWFADRQRDYLEFATAQVQQGSILNVLAHLERERIDPAYDFDASLITPEDFAGSFDKIDGFVDTADFDMLYLMNLWYGYADQLDPTLRARIEEAFLGFKYWYTDPQPEGVLDERWYWSENHRIIFHTIEYLAGQAFPDETFTVTGMTGAEHRDRAAAFIDEWLDEKARFGFTEWHSDVYYQKDVTPLLTLVEFADDPLLVERAAMILDLVLFDLAVHTLDGNNGATHGRSYMKDKSRAPDQDVFGTVKLLFDATSEPYASRGEPGATLLARARRYRLPQVIHDAATSPEAMIDRERMNVPIDIDTPPDPGTDPPPYGPLPAGPYGYEYDDPDNIPFWWERAALTAWPAVPRTLDTIEEYGLWDTEQFGAFASLKDIVSNPDGTYNYELAKNLAHSLRHMINIGLLSEVNTYTYRTGDVMLSTAQDYRPGAFGEQYHVWQATLGARASVFTTHPANEPRPGDRWVDADMYWTGTGTAPRSAQHGSVALHLYSPAYLNPGPGLLGAFQFLDYTHAWFPTEEFDEVVRSGNWTFGRKDGGYVALWSWRPVEWREHDPEVTFTNGLTEVFDLVAPGGPDNVWAVAVADAAEWGGDFAAFQAAHEAASPVVTELPADDGHPYGGFDVTWASPAEGTLEFGTEGDLVVDGSAVALDGYPRYDNPWTQAPFDGDQVTLTAGASRLALDFATWRREADTRR